MIALAKRRLSIISKSRTNSCKILKNKTLSILFNVLLTWQKTPFVENFVDNVYVKTPRLGVLFLIFVSP